jgi:hypothetical protein
MEGEEKDGRLNGRWGGICVNVEGKGGAEYRYLKMEEYVRKRMRGHHTDLFFISMKDKMEKFIFF